MRFPVAVVVTMLGLPPGAAAACWEKAAQRHGVSPHLLHAIARVESNLDPHAINASHRHRAGTYDIGLMQINSSHLPRLREFGIDEADLLEPCTSIHVGAWLLADAFARHGVTWDAVGAYNAACRRMPRDRCTELRSRYAWLVYRQLGAPAAADGRSGRLATVTPAGAAR